MGALLLVSGNVSQPLYRALQFEGHSATPACEGVFAALSCKRLLDGLPRRYLKVAKESKRVQ
jgi:hypothetical protein